MDSDRLGAIPVPLSGESADAGVDLTVLRAFLVVRGVHLAQALILVIGDFDRYRNRSLVVAILLAAGAESAIVAWRALRHRHLSWRLSVPDLAFGGMGLIALAACLPAESLATSLNWMQPFTVGSIILVVGSLNWRWGVPATLALAIIYGFTTFPASATADQGRLATAIANAFVYPAFTVGAYLVVGLARRGARRVDEARALALRLAERRATEQERARQHRLLHDDPVQVLEVIASGRLIGHRGLPRQRQVAFEAETRLKALLAGGILPPATLDEAFAAAADTAAARGLQVHLSIQSPSPAPPSETVEALGGAVTEALNNIAKHAGVRTAMINCHLEANSLVVEVTDKGVGFDPELPRSGFGISHSIVQRLDDVGGTVEVASNIGHGTRVIMRVSR